MKTYRIAALGAGAFALLAGAGTALAQSPVAGRARMIEVPPGAVVLVLPANSCAARAAFPAMPGADAMLREVRSMMAAMERGFAGPAWMTSDRPIPVAMPGLPSGHGLTSVFVTSVTDGNGTCTRQITYGDGARHVAVFGNGCGAGTGQPAALPDTPDPAAAAPRAIEVDHRARPALPQLIQADRSSRPEPLEVAQLR